MFAAANSSAWSAWWNVNRNRELKQSEFGCFPRQFSALWVDSGDSASFSDDDEKPTRARVGPASCTNRPRQWLFIDYLLRRMSKQTFHIIGKSDNFLTWTYSSIYGVMSTTREETTAVKSKKPKGKKIIKRKRIERGRLLVQCYI